jgi:hypothetical protein
MHEYILLRKLVYSRQKNKKIAANAPLITNYLLVHSRQKKALCSKKVKHAINL